MVELTSYESWVLGCLGVATFLNFYQPRAVYLVAVAFCFLFLLRFIAPNPDLLKSSWYPFVICVESAFIGFSIVPQTETGRITDMGRAIAAFSVWNILANLFGWYAYTYSPPRLTLYDWLTQVGEIAQLAALLLFSQPIIRLFSALTLKKKEANDNGHRSVVGSC